MKKRTIENHNIYLNNINGIMQVVSISLVSSFAGLFIKRLNASDTLVSLFNSLPAFFSVFAILIGTPIVINCKNKKKVTSIFFFSTRIFYCLMALVPFLNPKYCALAFVILYGAMNLPGSIATFLWQSFFADTFRPSIRSRVLSLRNSLAAFACTITTLIMGFSLHTLSSSRTKLIHYYQIMFIIAFIFGICEVVALYRHKDIEKSEFKEIHASDRMDMNFFKSMISQKKYLYFMIAIILFNFTWQMGWPLFLTYEVDYLHTNELLSGISAALNGVALTIGYIFWRKFSEKRGNSIALTISCIGMASSPFLYAISTSMTQVIFFNAIIGFSLAGVQLVFLSQLYELSPRENRTSYIAFYNLATSLTLVVAPFVGMSLYRVTNIKVALLIVAGLRFASSFLFLLKPKSKTLSLNIKM